MLQKEVNICKILQNICVNVYDWNLCFCFNGNKKLITGRQSYSPCVDSRADSNYYGNAGYSDVWQPLFYVSDYRVGGKESKLKGILSRCNPLYNSTDPVRPGNLIVNHGYEEHMILEKRNIKKRLPIVSFLPFLFLESDTCRVDWEVGKNRFHVVAYTGYKRNYYLYPTVYFNYLFPMDADYVHNKHNHNGETGERNVLTDTYNYEYGLGFAIVGNYSKVANGNHVWDANNGYLVWWDNFR